MARAPHGYEWRDFTDEQAKLLDKFDFYGNNGWARTRQTETLMPVWLAQAEEAGLSIERIMAAMMSIGYDKRTVHMLNRWESKRTTGRFGR